MIRIGYERMRQLASLSVTSETRARRARVNLIHPFASRPSLAHAVVSSSSKLRPACSTFAPAETPAICNGCRDNFSGVAVGVGPRTRYEVKPASGISNDQPPVIGTWREMIFNAAGLRQ